jgi:hypothetical protein
MVVRDGIEPPRPACSGLLSTVSPVTSMERKSPIVEWAPARSLKRRDRCRVNCPRDECWLVAPPMAGASGYCIRQRAGAQCHAREPLPDGRGSDRSCAHQQAVPRQCHNENLEHRWLRMVPNAALVMPVAGSPMLVRFRMLKNSGRNLQGHAFARGNLEPLVHADVPLPRSLARNALRPRLP